MADKQALADMLDAFVADNNEEGQIAFHRYFVNKTKEQMYDMSQTEPLEDDD